MNFRGLSQGSGLLSDLCRLLLGRPNQHPDAAAVLLPQSGAIPYRHVDCEIAFLIVTSRATSQWIFPKGSLMEGLSPTESAAQEAYEEAGVLGTVGTASVGSYSSVKFRSGVGGTVSVEMYPMEVTEQLDDWPEKHQRQRQWVTLAEARRLLSAPELVDLAEKAAAKVSG